MASVSGALQKVNKLMTVRSIRSRYVRYNMTWNKSQKFEARYIPEVGDLVVVRILEVCKIWRGEFSFTH